MPHTPAELAVEFEYRKQERLGILCGESTPTPEQIKIATDEARAVVQKLKKTGE